MSKPSKRRSIFWIAARRASPHAAALKKAVLLSFRITANQLIGAAGGNGDPSPGPYWDKVHSKFLGWGETAFEKAGFRAVPGAVARRGSFIAKNVVLMPCFVNIGAFVDEGTMVDTWAAVGSRRSASTSTFPAAPALAACLSRFRPIPPSSRTAASSARARK